MIAVITTPHWGDLVLLGLLIVGLFWLAYLGVQAMKLWIAVMRLVKHGQRSLKEAEYADIDSDWASDVDALAESVREARTEPHWPEKAPVAGETPAPAFPDLDEDNTPVDPTGQHSSAPGRISVDEVTKYVKLHAAVIPQPVYDTAAMDAVAAVSGQDGAP